MAKSRLERNTKKIIKKTHPKVLAVILIFLVLGLAIGGGVGYYITKDDEFSLVGEQNITLTVGQAYTEQGAKAVAFGKDIAKDITVTGSVDVNTAGDYVVVYKCNNFKYKNIKRVRYITVVEVA